MIVNLFILKIGTRSIRQLVKIILTSHLWILYMFSFILSFVRLSNHVFIRSDFTFSLSLSLTLTLSIPPLYLLYSIYLSINSCFSWLHNDVLDSLWLLLLLFNNDNNINLIHWNLNLLIIINFIEQSKRYIIYNINIHIYTIIHTYMYIRVLWWKCVRVCVCECDKLKLIYFD